MKQKLTVKTSKLLLPILIGIFVMSGSYLSLTFFRNNSSFGDTGYEFSEGNAVGPLAALAKTNFALPVVPIRFYANTGHTIKSIANPLKNETVIAKNLFRNVLSARAP